MPSDAAAKAAMARGARNFTESVSGERCASFPGAAAQAPIRAYDTDCHGAPVALGSPHLDNGIGLADHGVAVAGAGSRVERQANRLSWRLARLSREEGEKRHASGSRFVRNIVPFGVLIVFGG